MPQPTIPRAIAISRHTRTKVQAPVFLRRAAEPISNMAGISAIHRLYRPGMGKALVVEGGLELVAMVRVEDCPGDMFAGLNKHTTPAGRLVAGGLGTQDRVKGGLATVKLAGTLMMKVAVPPALTVASLGPVITSVGTVTDAV